MGGGETTHRCSPTDADLEEDIRVPAFSTAVEESLERWFEDTADATVFLSNEDGGVREIASVRTETRSFSISSDTASFPKSSTSFTLKEC